MIPLLMRQLPRNVEQRVLVLTNIVKPEPLVLSQLKDFNNPGGLECEVIIRRRRRNTEK